MHPRHLGQIVSILGTSVASLHVLAELVSEQPELLDEPAELVALADRLADVQRAFLRVSAKQRAKVEKLLGL